MQVVQCIAFQDDFWIAHVYSQLPLLNSIGLLVGYLFSSIMMAVVGSAVSTAIVCFAESPAEFEANHPELSLEMRSAWQ